MKKNLSGKIIAIGAYYLVPFFVLIGICISEIQHYYIPCTNIAEEDINLARQIPSETFLDELESFELLPLNQSDDKQLLFSADKILQGIIDIPGYPSVKVHMPFDKHDMKKGTPSWQLHFAGFTMPKILLKAYQITGADVYLAMARDVIVAWSKYERNAWFPRGYLWNDHAVAARIQVLGEFWKYYRNHRMYQLEVAQEIFQLASRSGRLLAKSSHFTFSTNHGIIQNLALWHLCLAFPTISLWEEYKQIAFDRMCDQMKYYINDEGIVLEHSAGYHKFGLELLAMACGYLKKVNIKIPKEWKNKLHKAKDFYAQLRRTDGSLPMFGDTSNLRDVFGPPMPGVDAKGNFRNIFHYNQWKPSMSDSLYPVAGYCIWWNGLEWWPNDRKLNQTVTTWSHYPGHGHKHADEMSVLLWAGGQTWWTNVGYWPYGMQGRANAESWEGSNAPHLVGEKRDSSRTVKLCSYGCSNDMSVIEMERNGPQGYSANRQVINVKPNVWVVLDTTDGKDIHKTTTSWTTAHNVTIKEGNIPGSYNLTADSNKDTSLTAYLFGIPGTIVKQLKGSYRPFAGWEANYFSCYPASAIVVEQPANNSWMAALWSINNRIDKTPEIKGQPFMEYWENEHTWKISIPLVSGTMSILRDNNRVIAAIGGNVSAETIVQKPLEPSEKIAAIHTDFTNAAKKYPKFKSVLSSRIKIPYVLISLFLFQEVFFFSHKIFWRKYEAALKIVSVAGWICVGIWFCC